jgi:hypothetical protein
MGALPAQAMQTETEAAAGALVSKEERQFNQQWRQLPEPDRWRVRRGIAEILPQIVGAWFQQEEQLRIVMRAYAEILLNDGAYEESVFREVVQVLEHFHPILFRGKTTYFERRVWKAFWSILQAFVPSALFEAGAHESKGNAQSLLDRFRYMNELTLGAKLEGLLQAMHPGYLMPLLNDLDEPRQALKEFARKVARTRHFLTHHNKKQARRAFSERELPQAVSSCWAVLTYWLARQLGIDEDRAGNMALSAKDAMFFAAQRAGL